MFRILFHAKLARPCKPDVTNWFLLFLMSPNDMLSSLYCDKAKII